MLEAAFSTLIIAGVVVVRPAIEHKRFPPISNQREYTKPTKPNTTAMAESINTNQPMDTSPGGENTQYESQKTFTQPPSTTPISQFRDPETGTVHLPSHRKVHAADIKARSQPQDQEQNATESQSNEGGEGAAQFRDAAGTVHLPTHRVITPAEISARARAQDQDGAQPTQTGSGSNTSSSSEDQTGGAAQFRDAETGTVHLPTHRKMRPADIKARAQAGGEGVSKERGEKTAENIRFGEAISEHGFGGETVGNTGGVGVGSGSEGGDGNGGVEDVRGKMGYSGGSGVGA